MTRARRFALLGWLALLALGWPAPSLADHVGISASVTANLLERSGSGSWIVGVRWTLQCTGVRNREDFYGDLNLVDVSTGEERYLGGVTGQGSKTVSVQPRDRPQHLRAELRVACGDSGDEFGNDLHGSPFIVVSSATVIIPALDGDVGDGSGGSGGGGSGGGGGGGGGTSGPDATEPLRSGGCKPVVMGTTEDDNLAGGDSGEVIFGLGGSDRIRGQGGHDCPVGGPGNDRLYGGRGSDRLTGGPGRDKLYGGSGTNAYNAGSGNDYVDAVNGRKETVRCGSGEDRARVDARDKVRSCEHVKRIDG